MIYSCPDIEREINARAAAIVQLLVLRQPKNGMLSLEKQEKLTKSAVLLAKWPKTMALPHLPMDQLSKFAAERVAQTAGMAAINVHDLIAA